VLAENERAKPERKFVLVQQQHDTKGDAAEQRDICETLTAERVRRVIEGYTYTKRGPKGKTSTATEAGLGGSFTYARVGDPLFTEYRDLGKKLPPYEDLAKYIFYTHTGRDCDLKKIDEKTGLIGQTTSEGGTAFYLFYAPTGKEARELSLLTLREIAKREKAPNWVIYCERLWVHPEELSDFEQDHNVSIKTMLVPFNLR
jgi:adenine-specific DNA-methyltransferase